MMLRRSSKEKVYLDQAFYVFAPNPLESEWRHTGILPNISWFPEKPVSVAAK
jgi:hypothetical protein